MKTISMSTQGILRAERADAWREVVCESIHNVIVDQISPLNFEAVITAQRHNTVSCAHFQSKAHRVLGAAERYADAGASGYLLSWQVEGQAHVAQGNTTLLQEPGTVAIVDGRRAMEVSFPSDVCRVVANLPARAIERRLPQLVRMHAIAFAPQCPFAEILFLYLKELFDQHSSLQDAESDLVVDNLCNLLEITATRSGLAHCDSKEQRSKALAHYLRREALRPDLSLQQAAGHLNISPRLAQQVLQEMGTNFTEFVMEERLRNAAQELRRAPAGRIADIAYQSGFNDVSHFNRMFKRQFGMTPSDYFRQVH